MSYEDMEQLPPKTLGPLGTIVAGSILVIIALIFVYAIGSFERVNGEASVNWPQVEGKITHSEVTSKYRGTGDDKERIYFPKIKYEYTVDDEKLTSDRIRFIASGVEYGLLEAEQDVKKYPLSSKVMVLYNPDAPAISCLEPGVQTGFLGWICLFLGFIIIISGCIAAVKKKVSSE